MKEIEIEYYKAALELIRCHAEVLAKVKYETPELELQMKSDCISKVGSFAQNVLKLFKPVPLVDDMTSL